MLKKIVKNYAAAHASFYPLVHKNELVEQIYMQDFKQILRKIMIYGLFYCYAVVLNSQI